MTNITSHTLGIVLWDENAMEEYVFPMIPKMTAMPCEVKNAFGTAQANMKKAVVRIVEGESTVPDRVYARSAPARSSCRAFLPKGSPVEICYQYNTNQVLSVIVDAFRQAGEGHA